MPRGLFGCFIVSYPFHSKQTSGVIVRQYLFESMVFALLSAFAISRGTYGISRSHQRFVGRLAAPGRSCFVMFSLGTHHSAVLLLNMNQNPAPQMGLRPLVTAYALAFFYPRQLSPAQHIQHIPNHLVRHVSAVLPFCRRSFCTFPKLPLVWLLRSRTFHGIDLLSDDDNP